MKKFLSKAISILLSMTIMFSLIPTINMLVKANEQIISTGISASLTPQYGSNGKFIAPIDLPDPNAIKIYTAQDLWNVRNNLSGSYILMNDIDLSGINGGEWEPIANDITGFRGTFDGQGYVIHNLKITDNSKYSSMEYVGLFGRIWTASIKNVGLENTYINITIDRSIAVGGICGSFTYDSSIINCYNMGSITVMSNSSSAAGAGGICGGSYNSSSILNCYNTSDITVTSNFSGATAGGIIASSSNFIENCYNMGNISAISNSFRSDSTYAGGICGTSFLPINNCYNAGNISITFYSSSATNNSYNSVGGICGYLHGYSYKSSIKNCYNTGDITGENITDSSYATYVYAGGICGNFYYGMDISKCFNTGNITSITNSCAYAGGISGNFIGGNENASINNCYNIGNITATVSSSGAYAGGILGGISLNSSFVSFINNCYNAGNINTTSLNSPSFARATGICNVSSTYSSQDNILINNCFWNINSEHKVNEIALDNGSKVGVLGSTDTTTSLITNQMKNKANFIGFDFDEIWDISPDINNGYPHLRNIPNHGNDNGTIEPPITSVFEDNVDAEFFLNDDIAPNQIAAKKYSVYWSDNFFNNDSTAEYNHKLANASMALSASAYNKNHIERLLKRIEIENIKQENYENKYLGGDSSRYTLAHKQCQIGGSDTDLFIIAISGTYEKEWYSNFDVGHSSVHKGFKEAADSLLAVFKNYYLPYQNSGRKKKILVTGHSRGAAVANLVAKELSDNFVNGLLKPDVFAYTFATPNVAKNAGNTETAYRNIHNLIHYDDFVPVFPITDWEFGRYGKTHILYNYMSDMEKQFNSFVGVKFKGYNNVNTISNFKNDIAYVAPTTSLYYDKSYLVYPWLSLTTFDYTKKLADILTEKSSILAKLAFVESTNDPIFGSLSKFFVINSGSVPYLTNPLLHFSHAPETYISWMQALPDKWQTKNQATTYAKIACPVNVEIYDENGKLVGRVTNNTIDDNVENPVHIELSGQENDIKEIFLPSHKQFNVVLTGTDTGTMDYIVSQMDLETREVTKTIKYNDIALTQDKILFSEISETIISDNEENPYNDVTLYAQAQNNSLYTVAQNGMETESDKVLIKAVASGNGSTSGTGTYRKNEDILLTAISEEGYIFNGWYENNVKISSETTLPITTSNNRLLEAKFGIVEVKGISLDKKTALLNLNMEETKTIQLNAIITPQNATIKKIAWESSNEEVAYVTSDGIVNAISPGTTNITVTTFDGQFIDICTITIKQNQNAPNAPTLNSKTSTSVRLNTITGAEYRRGTGAWQDSPTFTGLTPNTTYNFTARMKETITHNASHVSVGLSVNTDRLPIVTYTVIFKNGNKTLKTQRNIQSGKSATAPKAPTRKGYVFNGWDKKFNNTTKNLTVNAKWKKITASVTPKTTSVRKGKTIKLTAKGNTSIKSVAWKTSSKKSASIKTSGKNKTVCTIRGLIKGKRVTITARITFKDKTVRMVSRKITVK